MSAPVSSGRLRSCRLSAAGTSDRKGGGPRCLRPAPPGRRSRRGAPRCGQDHDVAKLRFPLDSHEVDRAERATRGGDRGRQAGKGAGMVVQADTDGRAERRGRMRHREFGRESAPATGAVGPRVAADGARRAPEAQGLLPDAGEGHQVRGDCDEHDHGNRVGGIEIHDWMIPPGRVDAIRHFPRDRAAFSPARGVRASVE